MQKYKVSVFKARNSKEFLGVNDLNEISIAEKYLRKIINRSMMNLGLNDEP